MKNILRVLVLLFCVAGCASAPTENTKSSPSVQLLEGNNKWKFRLSANGFRREYPGKLNSYGQLITASRVDPEGRIYYCATIGQKDKRWRILELASKCKNTESFMKDDAREQFAVLPNLSVWINEFAGMRDDCALFENRDEIKKSVCNSHFGEAKPGLTAVRAIFTGPNPVRDRGTLVGYSEEKIQEIINSIRLDEATEALLGFEKSGNKQYWSSPSP